MKTSVAMTTYNGANFIIEQLDSIKNQDMPADEVIILDDGSNDGTPEMVRKYIADNGLEGGWHFEVNEKNLGYANNFHKACNICSGDYVFFSDQDDIWRKDKISSCVDVMEKHENITLLCTDFAPYYMSEDAPRLRANEIERMPGDDSLELIDICQKHIYIGTEGCTMCVRKSYWDEIDKYWFSGWAHDEFIWKMALCTEGAWYYHHITLERRFHGGNVSKAKQRDKQKRIDFVAMLDRTHKAMLDYAVSQNRPEKELELIKKNIAFIELRQKQLETGSIIKAIQLIPYINYYHYRRAYPVEVMLSITQ